MHVKSIGAKEKYTSAAVITKMQTVIAANSGVHVDFDFLRENVPELSGVADGVVHQAIIDAGFEVEV